MSRKAELAAAVLGGAAAAGLALYAASRTWLVTQGLRPAPLPPLRIEHSGGELVPALPAFALVGLAGVGALLATRGRSRLVVAALVLAAGLGTLGCGYVGVHGYRGSWPVAAVAAGAVLAASGVLALLRGREWPVMGARYDRPRPTPAQESAVELWDAIERGEDPTGGLTRT